MKMRNYIWITFFLSLLFITQLSMAAEPVIQASFSVNPSVSSPGSDGYIQLNLKNTGSAVANSIKVTLTSTDTGINVDPYRLVNMGGLGVGESNSALFKFSVLRIV